MGHSSEMIFSDIHSVLVAVVVFFSSIYICEMDRKFVV